jgi:hypothetical protein
VGDLDKRCGTCAAFTRARDDERLGRVGECALAVFPPPVSERATCTRHRGRGEKAPDPPRARGRGASARAAIEPFRRGERAPPASLQASSRGPLPKEIDLDMDTDELKRVLRQVLAEELGVGEVALGKKWQGGSLVLKPGNETQEKQVPIEVFFNKIVMIRDKLRVLEQKVNASEKLDATDKVQLQQYITGCYGSLTSFNVLFAERDDGFVGQKGGDE